MKCPKTDQIDIETFLEYACIGTDVALLRDHEQPRRHHGALNEPTQSSQQFAELVLRGDNK
jgi:hypothetical protein